MEVLRGFEWWWCLVRAKGWGWWLLRPNTEWGLSLLYLHIREKCDLKGGNLETLELKYSTLSWLREVSAQRLGDLDLKEADWVSQSFPPSKESKSLRRQKPMMCADTCGLWEGGQTARGSECRSQGWKSARLRSSKRVRHFQRNSYQGGGNRPALVEWGREEENCTQKQQTEPKNKGCSSRKR